MLPFKTRRTSQPQGAVEIDWSNPLATGLVLLAKAGTEALDATKRHTLTPTSAPLGAGLNGVAWKLSGGSGSVVVPDAPSLDVTDNVTIFSLVRSTDSIGAQFIVNKNYEGGRVPLSLCIGGGGVVDGMASFDGAWNSSGINTDIRGDGIVHAVVGTRAGGVASYYIDGGLNRAYLVSGVSPNASPLYIGRYQNDSLSFRGEIYFVGIVNRRWTDAEVKAFSDNPWQLFKPASRTLWIPGTVSGGGGTSQVYSDAYAAYLIRSFAQQDFAASYAIRGAVPSDVAPSYNIRTAATLDLSPAFSVRGAVPIDVTPAYSVRGLVQSDEVASYNLRTSASSDLSPSYSIQNAGTVTIDLSPSYTVRATAQSDLSADFALRGTAQSDVASSYTIRASVLSSLSPSYAVAGAISAVQSDLSVSYSVFGVAAACPSAADIAAAVRSDLAAELGRLSKLAYLSGIDATLVVSQTSRTAGPVTQTISTSGGTTTVQSI